MTTRQVLELLSTYESPNVTFIEPDGSWPIVWKRAKGSFVWDQEGKRYLDLTAAFGVAAAGHANPRVVAAGRKQMGTLLHAMGDVHPHALKAELARELSRITFERWTSTRKAMRARAIFGNSGFEAVEAAFKTAMLATGKPGIIAFQGGYHGLGYGALNATHRSDFRQPFRNQLRQFGHFVAFPREGANSAQSFARLETSLALLFKKYKIGAIVVEPIQVRGGINIPPTGFLKILRTVCDRFGACLILDEIYTGFGRSGKWFGCEHEGVIPDLICLGKALTGGFPLSACVGRDDLMARAWPKSSGEAIHTSTFLGHPVGCAMALAQIREIETEKLAERSATLGASLLETLRAKLEIRDVAIRGLGLLAGVEIAAANNSMATKISLGAIKSLLDAGYIFLPEGERANVISLTPPLTISRADLYRALDALAQTLTVSARSFNCSRHGQKR
jgi:4-aminobutyrate aminotransferase-like enzyme